MSNFGYNDLKYAAQIAAMLWEVDIEVCVAAPANGYIVKVTSKKPVDELNNHVSHNMFYSTIDLISVTTIGRMVEMILPTVQTVLNEVNYYKHGEGSTWGGASLGVPKTVYSNDPALKSYNTTTLGWTGFNPPIYASPEQTAEELLTSIEDLYAQPKPKPKAKKAKSQQTAMQMAKEAEMKAEAKATAVAEVNKLEAMNAEALKTINKLVAP